MDDDSQQDDGSLFDLSLFLIDQALTIGTWDEWLATRERKLVGDKRLPDDVLGKTTPRMAFMRKQQEVKIVEQVVHEMESMRKELHGKLDQIIDSVHPLEVEARAEMSALDFRLFEIQCTVTNLVDGAADVLTDTWFPITTDPYELLRFDCKRLAISYLHPLETLAAKMTFASGLGGESSNLQPLSDQERAVDEVIVEANDGGQAITGPAILERLDKKSEKDINSIDGDSLKRILPKLRILRGLENRPNVGYFYPRYFKEP